MYGHGRLLVRSVSVVLVHVREGAEGGINDVEVTPLFTPPTLTP